MAQGQNNQFGLRLASCPKREVDGYGHAVPAIVALLAEQLVAAGGETVQGIFRKAPDKAECDAVKRALMTGTFTSPCTNVHVLANLLKVPTACAALRCSRCGFNTSHASSTTPCCLLSLRFGFGSCRPTCLTMSSGVLWTWLAVMMGWVHQRRHLYHWFAASPP